MSGDDRRARFTRSPRCSGSRREHTDALGAIHQPDAETLAAMVAAFGLPPEPDPAAAALDEMRRAAPLGLDPL